MTPLGVVIVTYNAADVICGCLLSLLSSPQDMRVVVVDNASTDATVEVVTAWRAGNGPIDMRSAPFKLSPVERPVDPPRLEIIRSASNGGFAAGVNLGIDHLSKCSDIDRLWILNPDTLVPPGTPEAIAAEPIDFDLMGTRVIYAKPPHQIQIDAGTINWWTGVTGNLNLGKDITADLPDETQIDFISGASLIASRPFIERAGPMPEEYFLYYEEVDWAQKAQRPFRLCRAATIYHSAGSALGSPSLSSAASPLSVYYKHRSRLRFLRKFNSMALPIGYGYGLAKFIQHAARGERSQARAVLRALHGQRLSADIAAHPRHQTF